MKYVFTLLMCFGFAYAQLGSRIVYSSKFIKAPGFIADSNFRPPSDTTNYKTGFAVVGNSAYIGNGTYWTANNGEGCIYNQNDITTSSTEATGTGHFFYIKANESYIVEINGICVNAGSNSGLRLAIKIPTDATISGYYEGGLNQTDEPMHTSIISASETLGKSIATHDDRNVPFRVIVTIKNSSNNGFVEFQFATNNGTAKILPLTSMKWTKAKLF